MGALNHSAKRGHWKPKVKMLKELIHWTAKGPEGGVPGQWALQEGEAFHKWIDSLAPDTQGAFFTRNGKVWGVIGPHVDSPESVEEDSEFGATLPNPRNWPCLIVLKSPHDGPNAGRFSFSPLWIDKAKQAIFVWEEKVPWEPEIGFIKEQNAFGVLPPKDGHPKNWMQRAKVVFQEYQLEQESERKACETESQMQQAKKEEEDDGKGYLSPRWDHIFNEIGASQKARVAYEFMDSCWQTTGLDSHLQGVIELLRNPKSLRAGYGRATFFKFLTDLFSKSLFWLELIHQCPQTGDLALDKKIAEWSGEFLAKHYGDAVRGWTQFVETDRSKRKSAKPSSYFLAQALMGEFKNEHGLITTFSPAGRTYFRHCFDSRMKEKRWTSMRQFAEHCLSRAGYLKGSESVRQYHRAMEEYHARREAAKAEGLPWEPLANSDSSKLLSNAPPLEKATYPQMSEAGFNVAWDRNGKSLRELSHTIEVHEKNCTWDSLKHYQLATKNPLPIKAVMQRELSILQNQFEREGRTKTVGGKKRNGAQYLSDVERELRELVRDLVGLGRSSFTENIE